MLSFIKEVIRSHYQIVLIAIVISVIWPSIQTYFKLSPKPNSSGTKNAQKLDEHSGGDQLFTIEQLATYNGENDKDNTLYLAILGSVFDVSTGNKHYGPGKGYNFFVGRDASVAFSTGDFKNTDRSVQLDDVLTLEPRQIFKLNKWKEFYERDYKYKGHLIGRFYDENGLETEYYKSVQEQIQIAIVEQEKNEANKNLFPPCNIEWIADVGTRVWCTTKSGGIERDWTGLPRKLYEPGKTEFRCACIHDDRLDLPNLKEYDDCDYDSESCFYTIDKDIDL